MALASWPAVVAISLVAMVIGYRFGLEAMRVYMLQQLPPTIGPREPGTAYTTTLALGQEGPRAPFESVGVFVVRTIVTLAIMTAALYVILSRKSGRYPPSDRKWAYAALAAIMAFWLAAGSL